jgi:hypothetical protein
MNKRMTARIIRQAAAEFAAFGVPMKQYTGELTEFEHDHLGGGCGAGEVTFTHNDNPDLELVMRNIDWNERGEIKSFGQSGGRLTL